MDEELEKLQGEWSVIFLEVNGLAPAPHTFAGAKMIIQGDGFTSIAMGARLGGKIELDPSKDPKTFRMTFTDGPDKGKTNLGIYDLDGDRWQICLTISGGPAPTKFATAPGSGHALETLNREPSARG